MNHGISAPQASAPSNKRPSKQPKFEIGAPPQKSVPICISSFWTDSQNHAHPWERGPRSLFEYTSSTLSKILCIRAKYMNRVYLFAMK